jgi:beta-barrel assembly-enhancing protease
MSRARHLFPFLLVVLAPCPLPAAGTVAARPDSGQTVDADAEDGLRYLQLLDQKVADISWRLAASNADICAEKQGALGIAVHEAAQYIPRVRMAAATAFGFADGLPAVLSVARGSPAQRAGILVGDRITAIDGVALAPRSAADDAPADYERIEALARRLNSVPPGTAVRLDLLRGTEQVSLVVTAASLCRVRVEVVPGGQINAGSDERLVQVKGRLADWVRSDDELALVIAHEMAHVFLAHHRRLDDERISTGLFSGFGRNGRKLRDMEREADRYGIFMAARAGYDYRIAGAFWRRLSKASGLGAIWAASHPNASNRGRNADAVVAELDALQRDGRPLAP